MGKPEKAALVEIKNFKPAGRLLLNQKMRRRQQQAIRASADCFILIR